MGWFDDLRNKVTQATAQGTSGLKRLAGQAVRSLDAPFVRPMIGFKPEIGGAILSAVLPEENPVKKLVDAGLYLSSGPLMMTAGLAGGSPQTDDPYDNWRALGYSSKQDMIQRIERQKAADVALSRRPANVFIADDYGPPRPVKYDDGTVLVGNYRVDRFNPTVAAAETQDVQPRRAVAAPATRRPEQEVTPPVTRQVPSSTTPAPRQAPVEEMNALGQLYAKQQVRGMEMAKGGELQRRLWESGEMRGMTPEAFMTWVEANPGLAYREAMKRGLLPEYETAYFQ